MDFFSEREQKIIKIIGRKKVTYEHIATELFKGSLFPFDSTISVANSVRRIIKKCSYHNIDWTFEKIRENKKLYIRRVKL